MESCGKYLKLPLELIIIIIEIIAVMDTFQ